MKFFSHFCILNKLSDNNQESGLFVCLYNLLDFFCCISNAIITTFLLMNSYHCLNGAAEYTENDVSNCFVTSLEIGSLNACHIVLCVRDRECHIWLSYALTNTLNNLSSFDLDGAFVFETWSKYSITDTKINIIGHIYIYAKGRPENRWNHQNRHLIHSLKLQSVLKKKLMKNFLHSSHSLLHSTRDSCHFRFKRNNEKCEWRQFYFDKWCTISGTWHYSAILHSILQSRFSVRHNSENDDSRSAARLSAPSKRIRERKR